MRERRRSSTSVVASAGGASTDGAGCGGAGLPVLGQDEEDVNQMIETEKKDGVLAGRG
jgi:hypothetical protein